MRMSDWSSDVCSSDLIESQTARNAFLDDRIAEVQKQIAEIEELDRSKSRLLARKQVIEELQASRSQMVHLFDELVRTIPAGIKLMLIQQNGENGRAWCRERVCQ